MNGHPQKLEETRLWQVYQEKLSDPDNVRKNWVSKVYDTAVSQLKLVPHTFPNFTLHDETHILNVMYAMGALLGTHVSNLSVNELELLMLAAALHDIGMVYDEDDLVRAFADERQCERFISANKPDLIGVHPREWPEEIRQGYLRDRHPFRVHEMLGHEAWRAIFAERPREILSQDIIVAVCQAHGEDPESLRGSRKLQFDRAHNADPLFCAMLLRLADLLDFDDTRTPSVLFRFAVRNEKSVEEWKKHMASQGFSYPEVPSQDDLRYIAECHAPGVEHAIREFLDWIDDELDHCRDLQRLCGNPWQQTFPFPREISRKGITRVGYLSDEFKLTMDQTQILKLLTGENLYVDNAVFVRELLQNAVDATLLRGKMDPRFRVAEARIDLWEWTDPEGCTLFRIDDRGTGMTLRMLKNYFLKIGNSYYTSREIKQDLQSHSCSEDYHGISRFGIGFLSCFLCGNGAEISTLYFDERKSEKELDDTSAGRLGYGLRMDVTGLDGYYVLTSQAAGHLQDAPLPAPADLRGSDCPSIEANGYRSKAGTSIVIRLDPGKMGVINLKKAAEDAICGARVPVYYNGERIGRTYDEIMAEAHKLAEKPQLYELTAKEKQEFDRTFPQVKGCYPRIFISVIPLDTDEFRMLPKFSGVVMQHELRFENPVQWTDRDQDFELDCSYSYYRGDYNAFFVRPRNRRSTNSSRYNGWGEFIQKYGLDAVNALKKALSAFTHCPDSPDALQEVWQPFRDRENLQEVWTVFVNSEQQQMMRIPLPKERGIPTLKSLTGNGKAFGNSIAYQGIWAVASEQYATKKYWSVIFFLEDELQPTVDIGRTKITDLSPKALAAITGTMCYSKFEGLGESFLDNVGIKRSIISIRQWRELHSESLGQWILTAQRDKIAQIIEYLRTPIINEEDYRHVGFHFNLSASRILFQPEEIISVCLLSHLQDTYALSIDYPGGQVVRLEEKRDDNPDPRLDLFPPMMFCKAADAQSRRFLCCGKVYLRKGITRDHPFAEWLLANAGLLNAQFERQFHQIISSLRNDDATEIIEVTNGFREQLVELRNRGKTNLSLFQPLTDGDFWIFKD